MLELLARLPITNIGSFYHKLSVAVRCVFFLLARLDSAYSSIQGAHKIWGQGGGEQLLDLSNKAVIAGN